MPVLAAVLVAARAMQESNHVLQSNGVSVESFAKFGLGLFNPVTDPVGAASCVPLVRDPVCDFLIHA